MVDSFGGAVVTEWSAQAAQLHHASIAWLANAPSLIVLAVPGWNDLFIDYLCKSTDHNEPQLCTDILNGFPMIGKLPIYNISSRPTEKVDGLLGPTVQKVWEDRIQNNANLLKALTESSHLGNPHRRTPSVRGLLVA